MPMHVIITRSRQQQDNFKELLDSSGSFKAALPDIEVKTDFDLAALDKPHLPEKPMGNPWVCDVCAFVGKSKHGLNIHSLRKHKA
jgi:hypothetical protein